ncbi:MAG: hypothetical protein IJJ28_00405, partial [Lentisphaeria bacterium]|nr:hypothetical protein [Lentisphaeria bacterium]
PALQQARERAHANNCINTLKQLGTAAQLYGNDSNGYWTHSAGSFEVRPWQSGFARLSHYLGGPKFKSSYLIDSNQTTYPDGTTITDSMMPNPFFCPKTDFNGNLRFKGLSAYAMAMSPAVIGFSMPLFKRSSYPVTIGSNSTINLNKTVSTSQMIIAGDASFFKKGWIQSTSLLAYQDDTASQSRGLLITRHNGRANLLYTSGNVGSMAGDDLFSDTYIAFTRGATSTSGYANTGIPQANQVTEYDIAEAWLGISADDSKVVKP